MDFLVNVKKYRVELFALLFSALIACSFFYLQASPAFMVIDAQSGIAVFFALIKSTLLFVFLTVSISKFLNAKLAGNNRKAITYLVITAALISLAGSSIFKSVLIKHAIEDSANPNTAPDRLRALVNYQSGYGYEIDNRIARNPATPVDVLESLYGLEGQIGTDMSLASNPNTPNYLLIELSKHPDELWRPHIINALARNPKVKNGTLFFDEAMVLKERDSDKAN